MKSFFRAFGYAFRGIGRAVRFERNLRVHLVIAAFATGFSFFYDLTRTEYAVLVLTFSSVIACELVNTAIEKAVDICSPERNKLAEFAKDAAAGAVLVTAIFAVVVGILLFWDTAVFCTILEYYGTHPAALAGLIGFAAVSALFIWKCG